MNPFKKAGDSKSLKNTYKKILVVVEFNESSHVAMDVACRLGGFDFRTVDLCHVVDNDTVNQIAHYKSMSTQEVTTKLRTHLTEICHQKDRMAGDVDIQFKVGHPVNDVLQIADRIGANLIVMGVSSDDSESQKTRIRQIARKSNCDVWLLDTDNIKKQSNGATLGCCDLNDSDQSIAWSTEEICSISNCDLQLLNVFRKPVLGDSILDFEPVELDQDLKAEMKAAIAGQLDTLLPHGYERRPAYNGETVIIENEDACEGIRQYATESNANCLVLGAGAKNGFGRITECLVNQLPCSIYISKS